MAKAKTKNRKPAGRFALTSSALIFLLIPLLALVVTQFVFNVHLLNRVAKLEESAIKILITDNLKGLNKDATVEPITGKVYMPETRLVLPPYPAELFNGIKYAYSPPANSDEKEEEFQITSTKALNSGIDELNNYDSQHKLFEGVPIAQACTRQVIIEFKPVEDPGIDGYRKAGSKQLADGRLAEIFVTDQCRHNSDLLISYLKQMESY